MIHDFGNRVLDSLERRLGHLALPHILRWVAVFQALTWLLSKFSPSFLEWIVYDQGRIFAGEVWRIFSWVVYPAANNPIFVLFATFFMFFINDSLERAWGAFRLNVYVFASVFFISLAGLLPLVDGYAQLFHLLFYSSAFLAFATLFPEHIIMLFGLIPVKAKWLGWANAISLLGIVLLTPPLLLTVAIVLLGMMPYLLTFAPAIASDMRRESQVRVRRHRFESAVETSDSFHECTVCGATEHTHPSREFRVAADGEEYCEACRKSS